jgi:S-DNA-T family DNA segregation ATPase FtsK/SpoIIIE
LSSSPKKRRAPQRRKGAAKGPLSASSHASGWGFQAIALILGALGVITAISVCSIKIGLAVSGHPVQLLGPVGHVVGTILAGALGWSAVLLALWMLFVARDFWREELRVIRSNALWGSLVAWLGSFWVIAALFAIFGGHSAGGSIGVLVARPMVELFSALGATLLLGALLLVVFSFSTAVTLGETAGFIAKNIFAFFSFVLVTVPRFCIRGAVFVLKVITNGIQSVIDQFSLDWWRQYRERRAEEAALAERARTKNARQERERRPAAVEKEPEEEAVEEDSVRDLREVLVRRRTAQPISKNQKRPRTFDVDHAFEEEVADQYYAGEYTPPPLDLLKRTDFIPTHEDDAELKRKSRLIESKLRDFDIEGRVTEVHPGPVITLFEFEPAAGVKVGRISSLSDDLSMTLKAVSVRIIAPIPGRGTVGIEVPNEKREAVLLRDVLESDASLHGKSSLNVCLGKDTFGDALVTDIATMPHLLIAGATGTGKSVCINAILLSLIYRATPAELGLILIDPKILELSVYESIPHLRVPVVTAPRQAKAVLEWAINEMNRRYRIMKTVGVRSIDAYNQVVLGEEKILTLDAHGNPMPVDSVETKTAAGQVQVELPLGDPTTEMAVELGELDDLAPEVEMASATKESAPPDPKAVEQLKPLPKIVIVIDELADLMLTVGKEIEDLIARLAQKARAAGIHLIVATQRPSVDVITGLIKANFPARLSFQVVSRVDSRTIIDSIGAEKLLGKGDMLFMPPGVSSLKRVHGAFVSDSEVREVVAAIKKTCRPIYDKQIMDMCDKALKEETEKKGLNVESEEFDPLYDQAVEIALEKGQVSTSMIQRVFRIGYNRAARIVESMEREGLVGPADGAKPRQVLSQIERQEA